MLKAIAEKMKQVLRAVGWNSIDVRVLGLISVLAIVGCGPSDAPRLAKAKGVVLLNGKAIPNVGVTFFPTASGPMAIGKTNEKGEFVMMTTKPGDGACVGTHQVTIGAAQEGASEYASASQIPQKYSMPATSGLSVEVKDGQANDFKLELGK
jgi:hypothetical protein